MKRFLKWSVGIVALLVLGTAIAWFGFLRPDPPPISPEDRSAISLVPLPAKLDLGNNMFTIDRGLKIQFNGVETPRLQRAANRFTYQLQQRTQISENNGKEGNLVLNCLKESNTYPMAQENESYSLNITRNTIDLSAPNEFGILRGLETLLQMADQKNGIWYFPEAEIEDSPRYPWRGLMIDVCRHWIPKEVILRNLDAMASVKLNVLHLHLTEHQGFRIESKSRPKLHEMGSNGNYFTQEDIKEIITYAADRGIRVVPEFDVPGHSTSWLVGHPELASRPGTYELQTDFSVGGAAMDPSNHEVYAFLDAFFGEMAELFPDDYIHIGGDEVDPSDWESSTRIQDFMISEQLEDYHALQAYFNTRVKTILGQHDKKMMGWDEVLHEDFKGKGMVVQSWRSHKSLWDAIRKGSKGILSFGYYLDHKQPASFHYGIDPEVIQGGVTIDIDSTQWESWQLQFQMGDNKMEGDLYLFGEGETRTGIIQFMGDAHGFEDGILKDGALTFSHEAQFGKLDYALDIMGDSILGKTKISVFTLEVSGSKSGGSQMANTPPLPKFEKIEPLTAEEAKKILGGEACMWTEMVNEQTIDSRIWPRASAVAEKLWSPKTLTGDTDDMYRRLMAFNAYLENLEIRHNSYREELLRDMVDASHIAPLRTLTMALHEDRFFNRMAIYDTVVTTQTPLNRIVDAAPPESYVAYRFGKDVERYLKTNNDGLKAKLLDQLVLWEKNHRQLENAFEKTEGLKEVEKHSQHLSQLAALGIKALSEPSELKSTSAQEELFQSAKRGYGGTILEIVEPIRKLVRTTSGNKTANLKNESK